MLDRRYQRAEAVATATRSVAEATSPTRTPHRGCQRAGHGQQWGDDSL